MRRKIGSVICLAGLLISLIGCSLQQDEQVVSAPPEQTEADYTVMVPGANDYMALYASGNMLQYMIQGHDVGIDKVAYRYVDDDVDMNFTDMKSLETAWKRARDWQKKTIDQGHVDLLFLSSDLDNRQIAPDILMDLEDPPETVAPDVKPLKAYSIDGLKSNKLIPIGADVRTVSLRKSLLLEVMSTQELEGLESATLTEILDAYYSKANAVRELSIDTLLNAAAEETPLQYPTLLRYHHNRLDAEEVAAILEKAVALKEKWGVRLLDENSRLTDTYVGADPLTYKGEYAVNAREIVFVRPLWRDPVIVGVGIPDKVSNTAKTAAVIKSFFDEAYQLEAYKGADYMNSLRDELGFKWGGYNYYPADPDTRTSIEAYEAQVMDTGTPYDVGLSRDFYEQWLEAGDWDMACVVKPETREAYSELMKGIYQLLLEGESPTTEEIRALLSEWLEEVE